MVVSNSSLPVCTKTLRQVVSVFRSEAKSSKLTKSCISEIKFGSLGTRGTKQYGVLTRIGMATSAAREPRTGISVSPPETPAAVVAGSGGASKPRGERLTRVSIRS